MVEMANTRAKYWEMCELSCGGCWPNVYKNCKNPKKHPRSRIVPIKGEVGLESESDIQEELGHVLEMNEGMIKGDLVA